MQYTFKHVQHVQCTFKHMQHVQCTLKHVQHVLDGMLVLHTVCFGAFLFINAYHVSCVKMLEMIQCVYNVIDIIKN